MKRANLFILALLMLAMLTNLNAQNNVGIGTTTPNASALLELSATDKGFLAPRVSLTSTIVAAPVTSPATGLLVFNTNTAGTAPNNVVPGFYYWDGTKWVQVGAAASASCTKLDEAYNCGGNGVGRVINANYGRVEFTMANTATNDEAFYIVVNKGTSAAPTAAAWFEHNQHGVGLQVDANLPANQYSAVQSTSYSNNTSTTVFPAGVAGYFSGTGKGVGVWAEYSGTNTGGSGLYAKAASGNNWGAKIYSTAYVGANIETAGGNSMPALQVVGSGASYIATASLMRGASQMDISNNAGCQSVMFNNLASEPTFAPAVPDYGMVGTASTYWYQGYAEAWNAVSRPELKRNITSFDSGIAAYILNDIKKMNPVLYKFNNENDNYQEGSENKTRYNMHLGLLINEVPDYIQDNTFNAVDIYALSTLTLAGVKINTDQIDQLTDKVNTVVKTISISDFGFATVATGKEIRINYSPEFTAQLKNGTIPVVSVTPSTPEITYYIKSQDAKGFVIVASENNFNFNWLAMAKTEIKEIQKIEASESDINPQILSQLKVSNDKKQQMKAWGLRPQNQPLQLIWNAEDGKSISPKSNK